MGIPSYFNTILQKYTSIYCHNYDVKNPKKLYLDANSIIYDCFYELCNNHKNTKSSLDHLLYRIKNNNTILFNKVREKIFSYILKFKPSHEVFIAFDGVVPFAKMKQQRERRYKSALFSELNKWLNDYDGDYNSDNDDNNVTNESDYKPYQLFNTVEITPGTEFMTNLDSYFDSIDWDESFCSYIYSDSFKTYKETNMRENKQVKQVRESKTDEYSELDFIAYFNELNIIVSNTSKKGEGEHKIFKHIRQSVISDNNESKETYLIYGLDADLFVLSLNHINYTNIYLCREKPQYKTILDKEFSDNEPVYINIIKLGQAIQYELEQTERNINECIKDYVLLTFLAGNDFLPHLFGLSLRSGGFERVFDVYRYIIKNYCIKKNKIIGLTYFDTDKNCYAIHWKVLKLLFKELSLNETEYVKNEIEWLFKHDYHIKKKWNTLSIEDKITNLPSIKREHEIFMNVNAKGWKERYYQHILECNHRQTKWKYVDKIIKLMCNNYIHGIQWVFDYYCGSIDFSDSDADADADADDKMNIMWFYYYNEAPLLYSIYNYIPDFDCDIFDTKSIIEQYWCNSDLLTSTHQLCYVLPPKYNYLLGEDIRHKLYDKYPELEVSKGIINTFLKCYSWESNLDIIHIHPNELCSIDFE